MTPLQGKVADLMRPLAEFYAMNGQTVPNVEPIEGEDMPQPYRQLLVHSNDMTPTLEEYWKQSIHLRPLSVNREGDLLTRQVVLVASENHRPVEFGAIKIHLQRLPEPVQKLIIEGHTPLGAILREHQVEHRSRPSGFFRIASDAVTTTSFDLHNDHTLYGRHNLLLNLDDKPIAEVVEILPPDDCGKKEQA